jgi:hypothetical protein
VDETGSAVTSMVSAEDIALCARTMERADERRPEGQDSRWFTVAKMLRVLQDAMSDGDTSGDKLAIHKVDAEMLCSLVKKKFDLSYGEACIGELILQKYMVYLSDGDNEHLWGPNWREMSDDFRPASPSLPVDPITEGEAEAVVPPPPFKRGDRVIVEGVGAGEVWHVGEYDEFIGQYPVSVMIDGQGRTKVHYNSGHIKLEEKPLVPELPGEKMVFSYGSTKIGEETLPPAPRSSAVPLAPRTPAGPPAPRPPVAGPPAPRTPAGPPAPRPPVAGPPAPRTPAGPPAPRPPVAGPPAPRKPAGPPPPVLPGAPPPRLPVEGPRVPSAVCSPCPKFSTGSIAVGKTTKERMLAFYGTHEKVTEVIKGLLEKHLKCEWAGDERKANEKALRDGGALVMTSGDMGTVGVIRLETLADRSMTKVTYLPPVMFNESRGVETPGAPLALGKLGVSKQALMALVAEADMTRGWARTNESGLTIAKEFVKRHASGDWGSVPPEMVRANEAAVKTGGKVSSQYPLGEKGWIVVTTEGDRSKTSVALAGSA